ncbi:uncharacterized protein LOC130049766 [Ostrea edulis]|uniref:uncharacterized protein LOC130049766 n=1 Tax=Ostrea edulis TaxID=37623 RepID=UPI0024AED437|nr:uncharacterized protein LOC130049766 [Ostrea edulis]
MMNVTNGTITEDDENFVVSRLQRELQHTGIKQYNCSNTSHTTQSEHSPEKASPYSEDNQSLPITYIIDCKIPGVSYLGTQNMTERGFACQAWNKQYPQKHNYGSYPGAHENFCRDFESDEPWCFTTNRKVVWERCIVPSCGVNATVNSSSCVSVDELNIPELKNEISCRSYCNWIRTTINDAIGKGHLQNGRTCGIHEKSNLIRRKEHLLRRGTFTPWMCSISIFDNKEDECTIPERQYSDLQWIRAALIVVGIYLMLVIVIVLTVKIHRMTKKLDVEIVQLEARAQRELLEIACRLMHRELRRVFRRRFRQRSTRYQSIAEDHYELIPIMDDPYEAPLRRPASLSGTGYQYVAPYEICKEGCFCRYCLDQAAKDTQNSFSKVEGAHGAVSGYESLQGITKEEPLLDEATSKKQTQYSLLNISPCISWRDDEGKASTLNDPSQSTRRRHSRRRMRRRRISDIDDHDYDGIGGGWIPLQQIKQTNEEDDEDEKFISQLLSDVKREPITDIFPGFGPFQIPKTLSKFKREEETESIPLSEFSFLEVEIQKEPNTATPAKKTEPDQPNFETEIWKHDETYKPMKEASNDLVHISDTKRKADAKLMTAITGVERQQGGKFKRNRKRCYP